MAKYLRGSFPSRIVLCIVPGVILLSLADSCQSPPINVEQCLLGIVGVGGSQYR